MANTKIEWATKSWNPITGCTKISEGCKNCYAERMSKRLKGRFGYPENNPFKVTFHPNKLLEPLKWKKPSIVFVCSMGDIFHEDVKKHWVDAILEVISDCKQHQFLFLTKRPENIEDKLYGIDSSYPYRYLGGGDYLPNLWLGVSCENQETANKRIPILLQIPAAVHFISFEPLLDIVNFRYIPINSLDNIDWVIVGSESGINRRPMNIGWVRSMQSQCQMNNIPFFFKQSYENNKKISLPLLDGKQWMEYPKLNT